MKRTAEDRLNYAAREIADELCTLANCVKYYASQDNSDRLKQTRDEIRIITRVVAYAGLLEDVKDALNDTMALTERSLYSNDVSDLNQFLCYEVTLN